MGACEEPTAIPPAPPPPTPPTAITITITGRPLRYVGEGDSLALQARVDTAGGSGLASPPDLVTWTTSDTGVLYVSTRGVVRGRARGYARVRAHVGRLTDSIWVRVTDEVPTQPLFHFEFEASVSSLQRRAAMRAAARWAQIVPAALELETLQLAAGSCTGALRWAPPVTGPERGVRVLVTTARLAAPAGTTMCHRRPGGLSAVALIAVSTEPVFAWYDDAMWTTIWLHELGHALGLVADLVQPAGSRVMTPAFVAGYRHDHGRPPDAVIWDHLAHWGGLPGDIMDGATGSPRATVISRATVGRLLDMGYPVELRQSGPLDLVDGAGAMARNGPPPTPPTSASDGRSSDASPRQTARSRRSPR